MKRNIRLMVAVALLGLLTGIIFGSVNLAQESIDEDLREAACQIYHLVVDEGRVRDCAGDDCQVIGGLVSTESFCIRGISQDAPDWAIVDLEPTNPDSLIGFVNLDIISPGAVGRDTSIYSYCDRWQVAASEVVVRECAEITCAALGGLNAGEQLCSTGYSGDYVDWVLISDSTDQDQWVDSSFLIEAEGDENCDAWSVTDSSATALECPDINCAVARNLTLGEQVCVIGEDSDDLEWISIDFFGVNGWLHTGSLQKMEDTEEITPEATALLSASPSPMPTATIQNVATQNLAPTSVSEQRQQCYYYTVNVQSANIRSRPTTDSTPLTTEPRNTRICVVGVVPYLENDWFVVDLNPAGSTPSAGFMHQSLLLPVSESIPISDSVQPQNINLEPTMILTADSAQGMIICPPQDDYDRAPFDTTSSETQLVLTPTPYPSDYCITATPTPLLTPPPTQVASQVLLSQDITLSTLGVRNNIELQSPQGSSQFRFFIPDDWYPIGSNILYLNLGYLESYSSEVLGDRPAPATTVDIRLDDVLISSVILTSDDVGVQTLAIPLPANILIDPERRTHRIELSLEARDHCDLNVSSQVFGYSDQSFIHFEYNEFLPRLDLGRYPSPFYNNHPLSEIESVILVLPSDFGDEDLRAAASISAGSGLLTENDLQIYVSTADALTEQERQSSHLILIGRLGTNSLTDSLYNADLLPTKFDTINGLNFRGVSLDEDDGVIQLIEHPENDKRVIMVVTGQTELAIEKAGQALAGQPSVMGLGGTLAIISEVQPLIHLLDDGSVATRMTFADLGFDEDIVVNGIGTQIVEVDFNFPLGSLLDDGAYVDVLFNNSAVLEGSQSTFTLLVNDIPIASSVLNIRDTSGTQGLRQIRAAIPGSVVQPGTENTLSLAMNTQENWDCNPPGRAAAWFTVSNQSEIYLPRISLPSQLFNPLVAQFPVPFNTMPNLSDVWISLPSNPSLADITQAMQIISDLGAATGNGEGLIPNISIGNLPGDADLGNYHYIIIGRPATNPVFARINDYLPQPFMEDTNELQQVLDDVTYRLLPGFEIGILESLHSPWAEDKMIMVVTGTSDLAQANAASALSGSRFSRSELAGNVVFVAGNTVSAVDTSNIHDVLDILEAVSGVLENEAEPVAATPTTTPFSVVTVTANPMLVPTVTMPPVSAVIVGTTSTPIPPTPIPTFAPLTAEEFNEVDEDPPTWANLLIMITLGSLAAAMGYGLFRLVRSKD
jgi:hypothetical protein